MNNLNQTLHLIFSSPQSPSAKLSSLVLKKGDTAIFLGDGVFHSQTIKKAKFKYYFLESDLIIRGVKAPNDQLIGFDAFVDLCEKFDNVMSWPK